MKSKHYDGIFFKSSVDNGKSYVFFCGLDTEHIPNAYLYPFGNPFLSEIIPVLQLFTECFDISCIKVIDVLSDGKVGNVIEARIL